MEYMATDSDTVEGLIASSQKMMSCGYVFEVNAILLGRKIRER